MRRASRLDEARQAEGANGVAELTSAQIRELKRRLADSEDPTRYLLVSNFGPRFALFYNVTDDVYAQNDPKGATLFKRRPTALAVKRLLGPAVKIVRCSSRFEQGRRVPVLAKRRTPSRSVRRR